MWPTISVVKLKHGYNLGTQAGHNLEIIGSRAAPGRPSDYRLRPTSRGACGQDWKATPLARGNYIV
eukprot:4361267-Pyramimonas_sp.AAC.1